MWERIRTAIFLLIVVGVAMFATHTALLMLPLLLVGVTVGSFEWSKLMLQIGLVTPKHFATIPSLVHKFLPNLPVLWIIF